MIGLGEKFADGGETGPAMGTMYGLLGIEAVLVRPGGPHAGYGGGGIDQHAIKVEQDALAANFGHAK